MLSGHIRGSGQIRNELQNLLFVRNVPGRQHRHIEDQSTLLLLRLRDAVRVVRFFILLLVKTFSPLCPPSQIYNYIWNTKKSSMNTALIKSGNPTAEPLTCQSEGRPAVQPVLWYGQIIILPKQNYMSGASGFCDVRGLQTNNGYPTLYCF
jgi:hypothetical protein